MTPRPPAASASLKSKSPVQFSSRPFVCVANKIEFKQPQNTKEPRGPVAPIGHRPLGAEIYFGLIWAPCVCARVFVCVFVGVLDSL